MKILIGTYFGRWVDVTIDVVVVVTSTTTSVDFKLCVMLSNPEMCMCFVVIRIALPLSVCVFIHLSLSSYLGVRSFIFSCIRLYLKLNQTVKCWKQENFTINHHRTETLLFNIHQNNKQNSLCKMFSIGALIGITIVFGSVSAGLSFKFSFKIIHRSMRQCIWMYKCTIDERSPCEYRDVNFKSGFYWLILIISNE